MTGGGAVEDRGTGRTGEVTGGQDRGDSEDRG